MIAPPGGARRPSWHVEHHDHPRRCRSASRLSRTVGPQPGWPTPLHISSHGHVAQSPAQLLPHRLRQSIRNLSEAGTPHEPEPWRHLRAWVVGPTSGCAHHGQSSGRVTGARRSGWACPARGDAVAGGGLQGRHLHPASAGAPPRCPRRWRPRSPLWPRARSASAHIRVSGLMRGGMPAPGRRGGGRTPRGGPPPGRGSLAPGPRDAGRV